MRLADALVFCISTEIRKFREQNIYELRRIISPVAFRNCFHRVLVDSWPYYLSTMDSDRKYPSNQSRAERALHFIHSLFESDGQTTEIHRRKQTRTVAHLYIHTL